MLNILAVTLALLAQSDTVHARITARIGENSPTTPFLLGEISGFAIDTAGRVYVADFQDPRIVVFGRDGRHLATIGRKGRGPGEFSAPTGPVIGPGGALYVRNMDQVERFTVDPSTGIASRFDRSFSGPSLAPWQSKLPSIIDHARRFYFPVEVGMPDGLTHYSYIRYAIDGRRLDSLPVPLYPTSRSSWASVQTSPNGGRVVGGLAIVPFHPVPAWTVTENGTVLSGPADRYELNETDTRGTVLRTIRRPIAVERIPVAERAESLQALRRRIDSLPIPIGRVRGASEEIKAQRLPLTYPFYRALQVANDNQVWVRRWSPPSIKRSSVFDVFTPAGSYTRTVIVPADCALLPVVIIRGNTIACMEVDPDTGAESVIIAGF